MSDQMTTAENGFNLEAILDAREALTEVWEAAQFTCCSQCSWLHSAPVRSAISGLFGLGAKQSPAKSFAVEADRPEVFAAPDGALTPAANPTNVQVTVASQAN